MVLHVQGTSQPRHTCDGGRLEKLSIENIPLTVTSKAALEVLGGPIFHSRSTRRFSTAGSQNGGRVWPAFCLLLAEARR